MGTEGREETTGCLLLVFPAPARAGERENEFPRDGHYGVSAPHKLNALRVPPFGLGVREARNARRVEKEGTQIHG